MTDADLTRSLGRIEGRLEGIERGLASLKETGITTSRDASKRSRELEDRISKLERGRAWLLGAAAAAGMGASAFLKYLGGGHS